MKNYLIIALAFPLMNANGAIRWTGAVGSDGMPLSNSDGITGYTSATVNAADPHTFRRYNSADVGLSHSLDFFDASNNPLAMDNVNISGNGNISFSLASAVAANSSFSLFLLLVTQSAHGK